MVKRIKKDLQDKDGPFSIGINEISDDFGRLLGNLVEGEFGNGPNGWYFKHPSGLAICGINTLVDEYSISTSTDGGYRGTSIPWYYPIEFDELPAVVGGGNLSGYMRAQVFVSGSYQLDRAQITAIHDRVASGALRYNVIAIGIGK